MSTHVAGSAEAIKAAFDMFGGNARAVSTHAGLIHDLEEVTLESDLDTFVSQSDRPFPCLEQSTSLLIHHVVDPVKFTLIGYKLASPYVRKAIWAKCVAHRAARVCVMRLIDQASYRNDHMWGNVASEMFDDIAYEMLQRGRSFRVQQIDVDFSKSSVNRSRVTPRICVCDLPSRQVDDITTLYNDQHVYPVKSHLTTNDGVIQPVLFQPTTGKKNSVNVDELIKTAADMCNGTETVWICFVVPPHFWGTFFIDLFSNSNMTNIPEHIKYWVLQAYPEHY